MTTFDRFETAVDRGAYVRWPGGGGFQPVTLRVNGVDLLDLLRRVEIPFVEAEFDRRIREGESPEELAPRGSLAGQYLYLSPGMTFRPSRNFLGEAYAHGFVAPREKSILLQCTCGITDCWFLLARITVEDDRVTWSDFEQFHRDWRYDLGPFVFERAAYEHQLAPRDGNGSLASDTIG